MKKNILISTLITLLLVLSACGTSSKASSDEITIGYFPNLTHIATIVALENDYFTEEYGEATTIETKTVTNGGLFMEALETKAIDIGTVGPGPALNAYVKNPGHQIVSGAVNGGAVLVAAEHAGIESIEDLDGKRVAIPVIGSTQDVMLRKTLSEHGLEATSNGGTVELFPAAPADTITLFIQKSVDATATQEPWGYVLQNQANGSLLLDWDEFAWGKDSTNTVVVASEKTIENKAHLEAYLKAHVRAVEYIKEHPEESKELVISHIKELTSKELDPAEVEAAFSRIEVTTAVNEKVIQEMADISLEAEYVKSNDIEGLINLDVLNSITK